MDMSTTPAAGLDGPSLPVRVEPITLPAVQPAPAREDAPAPPPVREPEKVPG